VAAGRPRSRDPGLRCAAQHPGVGLALPGVRRARHQRRRRRRATS
jgi:hypothetical protein